MRSSITPDAPVSEALRDLCGTLLRRAHGLAADHAAADAARRADVVRQLRKSTKSGRALLPILASAASSEALAGADRMLSDASAMLSPVRDRDAMLTTVERLFEGRSGPRVEQVKSTLRGAVAPHADPDRDRPLEDLLTIRSALLIERVHDATEHFDFAAVQSRDVARVVARSWRDARGHSQTGWNSSSDADSEGPHELRKACGRAALQVSFFEARRPKTLRRLRRSLRAITAALGDEHDLAIIGERVALERARFPNNAFVDAALELIKTVRERLREEAAAAVERAFSVRGRDVRRELLRALR